MAGSVPIVRSTGAQVAVASGNINSVPLPANGATGDLHIAGFARKDAVDPTLAGWAKPNAALPLVNSSTHQLSALYRVRQAGDGNPSFTHTSGNSAIGRIIGIRAGLFDPAAPFGGYFTTVANAEIPAFTTPVDNCLVIAVVAASDDAANNGVFNVTNPVQTGLTWRVRATQGTASGTDSGLAILTARVPTAGTYPAGSFTEDSAGNTIAAVFVVQPNPNGRTKLLGRTEVGTTTDFTTANNTSVWPFVADESGDLEVIYADSKVANTAASGRLGIYAADGASGGPGTLLGVASVDSLAEFNSVDVASATLGTPVPVVAGTTYWIGWYTQTDNHNFQGDAGGDYVETTSNLNFPNPFGTPAHSSVNAAVWAEGTPAPSDTTAPGDITITDITASRISRVVGKDATNVTFTANEPFVEYMIRRVANTTDDRTMGTLVEQAVVSSRSSHTVTITDDELVAAAGTEGNNTLKVFVKDSSGNWSGAGTSTMLTSTTALSGPDILDATGVPA